MLATDFSRLAVSNLLELVTRARAFWPFNSRSILSCKTLASRCAICSANFPGASPEMHDVDDDVGSDLFIEAVSTSDALVDSVRAPRRSEVACKDFLTDASQAHALASSATVPLRMEPERATDPGGDFLDDVASDENILTASVNPPKLRSSIDSRGELLAVGTSHAYGLSPRLESVTESGGDFLNDATSNPKHWAPSVKAPKLGSSIDPGRDVLDGAASDAVSASFLAPR